jgi:dihydroorotate dehydrogenase electron transfer subunit
MKDTKLQVIKNIQIAKDTYLLQLSMPKDVQVSCGQFVNVQVPNRTHLILKRPLGICEYSNASFSVCYEIKGKGTNALTELKSGDNVVVTMPLGNGFVIKPTEQKVAIVGGGAGLFPLKSIFDSYKNKEFYSFLGFRDAEHSYFIDDFKANSKQTYISSNDGSIGEKDFVTNLLAKNLDVIKPDVILSCGPKTYVYCA